MPDLTPTTKPTAQVAPYVDVLGQDLTVAFLLEFGGAEIYLAVSPKSRSRVAQLVGREKAEALARVSDRLQRRVPLANQWIAGVLKSKGLSHAEIARRMRTTDVTVRKWLSQPGTDTAAGPDPDQLSLF
ncbi:helix-turn-helix domain-containing protein [Sedimentitalea sp. JM2-8]|uniref:Helix-turn-helix domain-containing protein n=1 Tax=Sedimentitalea xiamensis TaxID=3050037 RepID=A0ABT7FC98_9RHOB|nr:helix-turn-helix domain-containing protein [Sedimentitalea xiamensis]MDK3072745.1 helix-turn-helix domain-containing protein [Sedimentitalea xiamensis]